MMNDTVRDCLHRHEHPTPRGRKVLCGYDGSVRNRCFYFCPHYRQSVWKQFVNWILRKGGRTDENR